MSEVDNQDQNLQLRELLATQETDEIVHKLKNGYFTDDAQEIALQVLNERGFNEKISKQKDAGLRNKTYTGETTEEYERNKHYRRVAVLAYLFPILVTFSGWILALNLSNLTEDRVTTSIGALLMLGVFGFVFWRFVCYATKYSSDDLNIVPSLFILSPLLLLLVFAVIQVFLPN